MKNVAKKKKVLTADEIAEEAMSGKDISKYFSGDARMMPGIRRVNVDFTQPMLKELDDVVANMNISRQAVIKSFVRQCLDRHYEAI
jgi:hypothetical protein